MNRELTNKIRFVLEELVPPVVRDSRPMRWLFRGHWGSLIDELEAFRSRAHFGNEQEYNAVYAALPRIHEDTDLSADCVARILADIEGESILDVGCGTGVLLQRIESRAGGKELKLVGVDFQIEETLRDRMPSVDFYESRVEALPFDDNSIDTVICTHVLEHILDIRAAVRELRRVARHRLLIVVPKEREYRFTFNPHLHFFAYRHSFLRHMIPVPASAHCDRIGRDFYYVEDLLPGPGKFDQDR